MASALKDEGILSGRVAAVRKKDEQEYMGLVLRVVQGITTLVNKVEDKGYTVPQKGFAVFGWTGGVGTFSAGCNEDGSEQVIMEKVGGIEVPVPLDEGKAYHRGFDPTMNEATAFEYEHLMESGEWEGVEDQDLDMMEATWVEYMEDEGVFVSDEGDNKLSSDVLAAEVHTKEEAPQFSRLNRRIEQHMERKSEPGLGYFMHGGKMCFQAAKEYKKEKAVLEARLNRGRSVLVSIIKKGKSLDLTTDLGKQAREVLLGQYDQAAGLGKALTWELEQALVNVKAVHTHYGREYRTKAWYSSNYKHLAGLKGMTKEKYEGEPSVADKMAMAILGMEEVVYVPNRDTYTTSKFLSAMI